MSVLTTVPPPTFRHRRVRTLLATAIAVSVVGLSLAPPGASGAQADEGAVLPRVGTYEGRTAKLDWLVSIDVVRRQGTLKLSHPIAYYTCDADGAWGHLDYRAAPLRGRRFARSDIVSLRGAFVSRTKARGEVDPRPELFGCNGGPLRFTVHYVGKRSRAMPGTYQGLDAGGDEVVLHLGNDGRIVDDFEVSRRLDCTGLIYGSLFSWASGVLRVDGSAEATEVDRIGTNFTYSIAFTEDGLASGTYRVVGPGCDTGEVSFTTTRTE
jgi:hypothetical protein